MPRHVVSRPLGEPYVHAPSDGHHVLRARLTPPPPPRPHVRREGAEERVRDGLAGPLTLIRGPAGAGKTVLATRSFAARPPTDAAVWLTVEPGDTPQSFWSHLSAGLAAHGLRAPRPYGNPGRRYLNRLADALEESGRRTVVFLDQFDTARAPEIAEGLDHLLHHSGAGLRVLVTCRAEPALPLHRFRAAGTLTEVLDADLRFTVGQAAELLAGHGLDVPAPDVRLLVERTGGWAAGLRLTALAMCGARDPAAFVRDFAADHTAIADFLTAEVLDARTEADRQLLLHVSVLDPVLPDLADALTGRGDSDATLARLARSGAFVTAEPPNYRLHPLFAETLRAHLRRRHPGLERTLRRRAARLLVEADLPMAAVAQAAAAGDWQYAAELVVDQLALGRFLDEPGGELRRVFVHLPDRCDGAAADLVRAARELADRDLRGGLDALRRADAQLARENDPRGAAGSAFLRVLAGRLADDAEVTRRAAADTARLMRAVPARLLDARPEIPAVIDGALGAVELDAGHLDTAEHDLATCVVTAASAGLDRPRYDALALLALTEALQGRLRAAQTHAEEADAVAERCGLDGRRSGIDQLALAMAAVEHDDTAAARTRLDAANAAMAPSVSPVALVESAALEARLCAADNGPRAFAAVAHARSALAGRPVEDWALDELEIAEASVHLGLGDARAAADLLAAGCPDRPEHMLARARALLAAGQTEEALELVAAIPADNATAPVRTGASLLGARAALEADAIDDALLLFREALGHARPERLRRVFTESGPWVRRLLRRDPRLAHSHAWLTPARPHPPMPGTAAPGLVAPLTTREREVLAQAAQMLSVDEIAGALTVSPNTVKTHLKAIYAKLCVARRSDAVHRARDLGIL